MYPVNNAALLHLTQYCFSDNLLISSELQAFLWLESMNCVCRLIIKIISTYPIDAIDSTIIYKGLKFLF